MFKSRFSKFPRLKEVPGPCSWRVERIKAEVREAKPGQSCPTCGHKVPLSNSQRQASWRARRQ